MKYLLSDIDMGEEEARAVADVVRSKWLSLGPRTEEFETRFAEAFGVKHAVAVANCTAALHLVLKACGIGPADEVLVPSYTFVASVNAILYQGAKPVFVDITSPHDLNLSISDLEAKITPRTAAILAVHMAGYAADMGRIMDIAHRHGLAVIEDACHAIGANYQAGPESAFWGRKLGSIGAAGCFSFFANKNLATGEGGMIITDDPQIAESARRCRSHGMTKTSWDRASGRAVDYDVVDLGYNYRSTEFTAALGLVQLGKLAKANKRRKLITRRYQQRLAECPFVTLPFADRQDDSAHHIFPILLSEASARPLFRKLLAEQEIQTSIHYPPVHLFAQYVERCPDAGPLTMTTSVSEREVTLPLHPLLGDADVDFISDQVWRAASMLRRNSVMPDHEFSRVEV
jgi:dTDP-4-amino-4,6-dideoxygalactose transaminase